MRWIALAAVAVPLLLALVVWVVSGDYRTALTTCRVWFTRTMWRPREWRAWWNADVYPPEAAEAPDDLTAVADAVREDQGDVPVQRAEPFTGDNVTVPPAPAIVAADDITTYEASAEVEAIVKQAQLAYKLHRGGVQNFGGSPELGAGARWTRRGWKTGRRVR